MYNFLSHLGQVWVYASHKLEVLTTSMMVFGRERPPLGMKRYPLPTSFPYIVLRLFIFPLLLLSLLQNTKNITLLLNTLLQILSFQLWLN